MDNQILFELGLDSHKAVNAWETFVQEIQKGNNTIFSFISKVSDAFNNQEKSITQLVNSNNKLTDSQNKLTNSTNNLNVASNNQKNILKSQVIEQESLNQSYTKEQQSIQNIINAQQLLQKERKQSIDLLRAENKENNLKIADIRIDNKALSFDTSKNEIQKTIDRNLNNQAIIEYERRNAVRNLEIKAIQDEINKTNELLLVQKELLIIDKVKSSENKNSINDTNLKIKTIQLENESLREQEKIKRDAENKAKKEESILQNKIQLYTQMFDTIDKKEKEKALKEQENLNKSKEAENKQIQSKIQLYTQMFDELERKEKKNNDIEQKNIQNKIQLYTQLFDSIEKNSKKESEQTQTKLTKEVTKEASSDLKDETTRLLNNQKRAIEEKKQAEIEEIKVIQAKIIAASNLAKDIKEEISLTNSKKFALKNITDEQKAFNNNIDKNVLALKEQKRELTDNIRLLTNKRDNLKNSNVEILANTNAIAKNISELERQKALISSMPKPEKDNNALSSWEKFVNRVQNNVVGTVISATIRSILYEIRTLFQETSKEFIQLERNVAAIKGLILDNPISTKELQGKITEIADKTGSSIADASENIRTIITAGINDISEATKIYDESLVLARTSVSKTKTEQQALNDVMNSAVVVMSNYKLRASDLPTVFNQISISATKSRLETSDFAKYLGGLSSTFSGIKTPLNEVMALFSVFSNKLRSASEANTALTNIAKKLQNPTATQKKEIESINKQTGGDIEFSVSYIDKVGGINNFLKKLFADLQKIGLPDDAVAKLFNLQAANKGFKDLAAVYANVNKEGLNEFEVLNNQVLNNVDDLKQKNELMIKTFERQIETLKNSFINLFMKSLMDNQEGISNFFDNFTIGLNVVLGISSEIGKTLQDNFFTIFSNDGPTAISILQGISIVIEFIIKSISLLATTTTGALATIGAGFSAISLYVWEFVKLIPNMWDILTGKTTFKDTISNLKNNLNTIDDTLTKKLEEINEKNKNKLFSLVDLNQYNSINPPELVNNKLENRAKTAQNKSFLPPVNLVGEGIVDFNTKLSEQAQEATLKASLDKFAYKRDQLKKALEEDKKKSFSAYDTLKTTGPKQIEELKKELLKPDLQESEKQQINTKIEKLNNLRLNNEQNYKNAQLALAKRYKAELLAIDKEELKDRETKIKQAEALYKKKVEDKFLPLINDQKTAINKVESDNQDKSEIQRLELKNIQIYKLIGLEQQYANQFKQGSQERALILKQASISDLERLENKKKILKLEQQDRLENAKTQYSNEKNLIKREASRGDFNKDIELNNENFLDKQRIIKIKESLETEKNLTFEQKKGLNRDIQDLEQSILDNDLEKQKIRKQRIIENTFFEIDQEKIKFNLLVEMGQESNRAQLENDITTNNKMIAEYQKQIDLLDEIKSSDEIKKLKDKITPLQNANELDKYKINELSYKLQKEQDEKIFSDKNKSLELFRNLQIYSEETLSQELIKINDEKIKALENQEKIFIATYGTNPENEDKKRELDQLKESILDTNNFILVESKKLTEAIYQEEKRKLDIQIGFLDNYSSAFSKFGESLKNTNNDVFSLISSSFTSLSENYNKAIDIFRQIEPIQKQIDDNNSKSSQIGKQISSNSSNYLKIYNESANPMAISKARKKVENENPVLKSEQEKIKKENENAKKQADAVGITQAVEVVAGMISKGIDTFNKQDEATKKLSQTYKLFGKDSKEVALAQSEVFESGIEIIKALPVLGDVLYKVTRIMTDFFGATKSEKEKKI